ncbi:hypothetical protein EC912_106179 [Luteibacter rhizovicinus]|uniref:Uncharacterized protein n=1 Tax=Luteibacter rhizovicinus TaxID=242606 RepID=A0A4R3YKR2_9GAMM|nr:hypothetical protein [Luteibacter rhizovicinus]TCV92840.1 hypothetical protein EC912_106179 [Luteibacter rhizovicinus]
MFRMSAAILAVALAGASLTGCHTGNVAAQPKPVAGVVTDMKAFDAFIATHPTVEQFKTTYPDVTLVPPGTMATREMRHDNSRYFAQLDADGRIVGGKFM